MDEDEVIPLTSSSKHGVSSGILAQPIGFWKELSSSADLVFQSRFTMLLFLGPIAVLGDATGLLGPAACFAFSGLALIPCAERLSFVTEQVAEHTNGTIGALLNATFGNAPELLISVAALKSGYYRVVQLTMLGSMFTNMILVFGVACLIGGLRWQVQDLRITSGNVNVLMLLLATSGLLFPAALVLTGQLDLEHHSYTDERVPSAQEVKFSRVNAAVMLILYICYVVFQLGTHKDEFDDEPGVGHPARHNLFCRNLYKMMRQAVFKHQTQNDDTEEMGELGEELREVRLKSRDSDRSLPSHLADLEESNGEENALFQKRRQRQLLAESNRNDSLTSTPSKFKKQFEVEQIVEESDDHSHRPDPHRQQISFRVGVGWLFIITLCVSAITDVLVETIDGFAVRMKISEVFTSMVIIPFFSNVAEQVSAFIFAYRNKMDLCVGVTVGSAIQIATFVLPGSVLIGMVMDRNMTLFFHGYETASLFFAVIVVGAILQGGTTNWLVGVILVGIYIIFASGIWFHEIEELTIDAESLREKAQGGAQHFL